MAVDDFVLVITDGWVEVAGATNIININGGASGLQAILASSSFAELNEWTGIKETTYLPDGYTVTNVRSFDTAEATENLRLWIKIAPI